MCDQVDILTVFVKLISNHPWFDKHKSHQTAAYGAREPCDIDKRGHFLTKDISPTDFKIVFKHSNVVKLSCLT